MSRYGSVNTGQPALTRVVEAAEPGLLALRVNAAVAELALAGATVLTVLSLAGAGDGHTFTVTIEAAAPAAVVGGITPFGGVRCYLASSAEALALARQAAALPAVLQPFVDSQVSGSSKGSRFMGMLVYGSLQELSPADFSKLASLPSGPLIDIQMFTTVGTTNWVKPPNVTPTSMTYIWGNGASGGSGGGAKTPLGTLASGGSGAGGGAHVERAILTALLPDTVPVTIGAGGTAGVGATVDGPGGDGTSGASSVFNVFSLDNLNVRAHPGGGGAGGELGTNSGGGGGGGAVGGGGSATAAAAGAAGVGGGTAGGSGGGGGSVGSPDGGSGGYGGVQGGTTTGGFSFANRGGAGGGAGGGIGGGGLAFDGSPGGRCPPQFSNVAGGLAGGNPGVTPPTDGIATNNGGSGASGGGGNAAGNGGPGAQGTPYGGGPSGGGSALSPGNGGPGADGLPGFFVVITVI